jgi:hypothetical protein
VEGAHIDVREADGDAMVRDGDSLELDERGKEKNRREEDMK